MQNELVCVLPSWCALLRESDLNERTNGRANDAAIHGALGFYTLALAPPPRDLESNSHHRLGALLSIRRAGVGIFGSFAPAESSTLGVLDPKELPLASSTNTLLAANRFPLCPAGGGV
jgi:hypothetical protein